MANLIKNRKRRCVCVCVCACVCVCVVSHTLWFWEIFVSDKFTILTVDTGVCVVPHLNVAGT